MSTRSVAANAASKKLQRDLTWFAFMMLTLVLTAVAFYLGFGEYLFKYDFTYLGFAMIAAYIVASLSLYRKTKTTKLTEKLLSGYWFLSDTFLNVGLVGTVIGLLYAFRSFDHIPSSMSIDQIKPILASVGFGTATALLVTLVGLVASVCMKVQLWILER